MRYIAAIFLTLLLASAILVAQPVLNVMADNYSGASASPNSSPEKPSGPQPLGDPVPGPPFAPGDDN